MEVTQITTDWKFWSFLVAAIALILSQLPPIHILIRKAKLDLELYSRIFISHKIGNPNLQMHLILRNIGGRNIRVKKITANVLRNGKHIFSIPAQSYIPDPKDNRLVLLTSFDVKPDEEWNNQASFFTNFERSDEKIYRESEQKLKDEFIRQRNEFGEKHLAKATEEFTKPFNDLFDKMFNWQDGEYVVEVVIETDKPKANITKQYRFTIFESLSESLLKHKEGFEIGAGIYWDSPNYVGFWVEVEEKNS
jgi:hypothetical protein